MNLMKLYKKIFPDPKYCDKCGRKLERIRRRNSFNNITGEVESYEYILACPNYLDDDSDIKDLYNQHYHKYWYGKVKHGNHNQETN